MVKYYILVIALLIAAGYMVQVHHDQHPDRPIPEPGMSGVSCAPVTPTDCHYTGPS